MGVVGRNDRYYPRCTEVMDFYSEKSRSSTTTLSNYPETGLAQENGIPRGKTSIFWAIFLVVNAALGAGLLAFPLAFYMSGGVMLGVILELVR